MKGRKNTGLKTLRKNINKMSDLKFGWSMYGLGFVLGCGFVGMLWFCL